MNPGGLIASGCLAAVTGLVLYALAARRARAIERSAGDDRVHDLRVAMRRVLPIAAGCGGGAAVLCLEEAQWRGIGPGAAVVTVAVALACLAFPPLMARRPAMATYARLRSVPVAALLSYRRTVAVVLMIALVAWPAAAALAITSSLAGRIVIVLAGYLAAGPVLTGLLAPAMAWLLGGGALPAGAEARLSRLAAQAGVRVRGRLVAARARKVANAWQVGWLPGLRYVLITDYLLDELTGPETDAVMAHELGHGRQHDSRTRQLIACLATTPLGLLLVGVEAKATPPYVAIVAVAALAAAAGSARLRGRIAIRWELAADDLAVRLVGPDALAAALARLTELNAIKRDTSLSWDRRVGHPGMAMRIARLRPERDQAAVGDNSPDAREK